MMARQTLRVAFAAFATLALLAGCGTLPDAKPFADASATLGVAVKSSGQALTDSLREAGSATPADQKAYEKLVDGFEQAWASRVTAMQGVVAYSDAIADIVSAGQEGEQTAKKVGDSLKALASAVNVSLASPAVGVASDIGVFLAKQIAVVEASRKLDDTLAKAQPAVDRIAAELAAETEKQLKPMLRDAYKNIVSGIKSPYDADDNFIRVSASRRTALREKALSDSKAVQELGDFERVQAAALANLKERDQKIDQATTAYRARQQLLTALSDATGTWAAAHRDLAAAVRDKRKVSVTELVETVAELKELIRKVRTL
jgi:hypothetical protein